MSFVSVAPDILTQTAGDLASIGSTLSTANAAAAAPTTTVLAPAADEISTAISTLLGTHAQQYQTFSRQAEQFHSQFVNLLNNGAGAYANTEATNTQQAALASAARAGAASTDTGPPAVRPNPAPTAVEYIVMLTLIRLVMIAALSQVLSTLSQTMQSLLYSLEYS